MLMPLLVRLRDSEIEAIDLVVSQGLYAFEDCGVAVEEVGSAGLESFAVPIHSPSNAVHQA